MAFTSLGVVLISTLTFVLGTFPEFQSYEESGTPEEYPEAVLAMEMIDNVLVGFFVIEYVVRFFFSAKNAFLSKGFAVYLLLKTCAVESYTNNIRLAFPSVLF